MLLGLDEPAGIDAVAFCRAFHLVFGEQIRISTRKRDPVKGPKRGLRPPPVPMLVTRLRPIGEGCEDLDQHMIAAKAESGRRHRYARGGANAWVMMAQPGEAAVAIARMKTSIACLSSVGSQHVAMNTRCPVAKNGSNFSSEEPYDVATKVLTTSVPRPRNGARRASPCAGGPHHVGTTMTSGRPSGPPTSPSWIANSSGAVAMMSMQASRTALASANGNSSMPECTLGR